LIPLNFKQKIVKPNHEFYETLTNIFKSCKLDMILVIEF